MGHSSNQSFISRFAFVDLSAGPFAWGPSVGGDGVRTELSLPNVEKTVGAVAGHHLPQSFLIYILFQLLSVIFS